MSELDDVAEAQITSTESVPELTLGDSRVLVKYSNNPEQLEYIAKIRGLSATLIDLLNEHMKTHPSVIGSESARVYANAMTEVEGACMWAIKAICK